MVSLAIYLYFTFCNLPAIFALAENGRPAWQRSFNQAPQKINGRPDPFGS